MEMAGQQVGKTKLTGVIERLEAFAFKGGDDAKWED